MLLFRFLFIFASNIYTLGVFDKNVKMVQVEKMELH